MGHRQTPLDVRLGLRRAIRYLREYPYEWRERQQQHARNLDRVALLGRFIAPQGIGAELGVHKGYFSPILFTHLAPRKLYLIDPWYLQSKSWCWGDGNRNAIDALRRILREMEEDLVSGNVVLTIEDDLKALADMPNGHLDWVYLDTTHQYQQTVKELQLLKAKVKADGIIAGDDWQTDPSHEHHGLCRAVQEFVDRENYRVLHADTKSMQWAIRSQ